MANVIVAKRENYNGSTGHRNNFSGRAGSEGFLGSLGNQEAAWESAKFARRHTPYPGAGSFGITHMRPCDSAGAPLSEAQAKNYKLTYNGRKYPLGENGEITFCDTEAFMPALKDRLEMENYL